ncbi:MAG: tetratricopeptide repeat protein [Betaproteobacteria bacterium]|nr:tetratricopeptide repeat protein [Betaproteobacteria bacterium]
MAAALPPAAAQALRQAVQALRGDAAAAARADAVLQSLASQFPQSAEVHYATGMSAAIRGDTAGALAAMQRALERDRGNAAIHFQMGMLLDQAGRFDESPKRYRDALRLNPRFPEAHYNLGLALSQGGDTDGAIRSYRQALAQRPTFLEALNNLGNLLQAQGKNDEAIRLFREAIRIRPDFAVPYNNLGNSLARMNQRDEAVRAFEQALALAPRFAEALQNLAENLQALGRHDEAAQRFEALLAVHPENENARFALAALRQERVAAAPDTFVRKVFDDLAPRFESHLVETLGYRIPQELLALLKPWLDARGKVDVLDLGAGTGLFGREIKRWAKSLAGCDLAGAMVERCRASGIYDRVEQLELTPFLASFGDGSADVVAATDVFVYVGDLSRIFAEVARVLRPGGRFGFSVEIVDTGDFTLRATGRFAQSKAYIEKLGAEHGLTLTVAVDTPIRKEAGTPIPGWLVVLEKRA